MFMHHALDKKKAQYLGQIQEWGEIPKTSRGKHVGQSSLQCLPKVIFIQMGKVEEWLLEKMGS